MSFTATHYNRVAAIIREERTRCANPGAEEAHNAVRNVEDALRRMFASDNPRFDAKRFADACEPKGSAK